MAPTAVPPRVLLVMPAQWPRALLRAALRELGYDASGTRALKGALHQAAPEAGRGPVRLVVLDQDALTTADGRQLEELRRITSAPIVLLAPVMRRVPEGPWTRVVRRPVSIGSLVRVIETLIPLAPEARQPID
jgi:hypothetical protein